MAFLEEQLDTRITRGAQGGPRNGGRTKVYTASGRMRQQFLWSAPVHDYDVSHGLRSAADFDQVLSLWYVVHFTPYEGFRFKDWRDYQATQLNSALRLIEGTTWQLCRRYATLGAEFLRPIQKPRPDPIIFRTRGASTSVASATVDETTGIADVDGHAPGDVYSWQGQFDVPVTFADDSWLADMVTGSINPHVQSQPIKLEEVRL